MFTCFLRADQVLCWELGRHKLQELPQKWLEVLGTCRELQEWKPQLLWSTAKVCPRANMSTCKCVPCSAWELLAKITAYDLYSLSLPLKWGWTLSGLCCWLSPRSTVLCFHGLQSHLALTAGPLPYVASSQNRYSQWFYNHYNNLHGRNLSIPSQISEIVLLCLEKVFKRQKKKSQRGVKVLLHGSKGKVFSMMGKSGFVTSNKYVVDWNEETWWKNMLWLCYDENSFSAFKTSTFPEQERSFSA